MTDCYRILGISRHASAREVRAAYLARIKLCHPDAARSDAAGDAREIGHAYWQLRDADRRAEHDATLFAPAAAPARRAKPLARPAVKVSLRKPPRAPVTGKSEQPVARSRTRRPPVNRRLRPLRAGAGIAACGLAIAVFWAASTSLGGHIPPQAHAAARLGIANAAERLPPLPRRPLDPQIAEAAATEFRQVVARSGLSGAHLYARQCLLELAALPTAAMLDYCLAFDDAGSAWERTERSARAAEPEARRYFAAGQRFGRYENAGRDMLPGPVRESLTAAAGHFASLSD